MKTNRFVALATVFFAVSPAAQQPFLYITPQQELQVTGQTGNYHRILSSTNLADWAPQGSYFQLLSAPYTRPVGGTDAHAAFFRAIALPFDWTVMNNSYPDPCAEHDNINVVFRITNFWIIATHPTNYLVTNYICNANYNNCGPDNSTNYYFDDPQTWNLKYGTGTYGASANIYRKSSFWRPQGMTFTYDGMFPETNIHEVDFGREIVAGGGDSPGYFDLYSDGYIREIPFRPNGASGDPCFGTSVLVGPAAIADRPYADIESADLWTSLQTIFVTYRNGGTATIDFSDVTKERTIIKVTVNFPTTNSTCTVRSQFASVGDSDCDTVTWTDNAGVVHTDPVISFVGGAGTDYFFNRRVRSIQRESSPDTHIVPQ